MMMTTITTSTMLWKRVLKRLSESQLNLELDGEEGGRSFPHRFRCPSETKLVTKRSENLLGLLILTVWMTHHSKTQISSHVPSALSRGHLYLCVISWYKRYIAVLSILFTVMNGLLQLQRATTTKKIGQEFLKSNALITKSITFYIYKLWPLADLSSNRFCRDHLTQDFYRDLRVRDNRFVCFQWM